MYRAKTSNSVEVDWMSSSKRASCVRLVSELTGTGTYNVMETSLDYGKPVVSTNLAYAPRTLQLGFRVTF